MNDNRTTELREKLDELGIEHFDYDKGGRTQTMWESPEGMRHFTYETAANPAKTAKLIIGWFPTPEQAIAATLGGDRHHYEQRITGDGSDWGEIMTDAFDSLMANASESCTPEELAVLDSHIAATLGDSKLESYGQVPELGKRESEGERESYESRYEKLFGTPERAARTMVDMCEGGTFDDCGGCPAALAECKLGDYDALLEWLRDDAE